MRFLLALSCLLFVTVAGCLADGSTDDRPGLGVAQIRSGHFELIGGVPFVVELTDGVHAELFLEQDAAVAGEFPAAVAILRESEWTQRGPCTKVAPVVQQVGGGKSAAELEAGRYVVVLLPGFGGRATAAFDGGPLRDVPLAPGGGGGSTTGSQGLLGSADKETLQPDGEELVVAFAYAEPNAPELEVEHWVALGDDGVCAMAISTAPNSDRLAAVWAWISEPTVLHSRATADPVPPEARTGGLTLHWHSR